MTNKKTNKSRQSTTTNEPSISFLSIIFWTLVIICSLLLIDKYITNIPIVDNIIHKVFKSNKTIITENKSQDEVLIEPAEEITNQNQISFSEDAIQEYNSSVFIEAINPSDDEKKDILAFLTRSKSYSNSESGSYCDSHGLYCFYCGNLLTGQNTPIYDYVKSEYISNSIKGGLIMVLTKNLKKEMSSENSVNESEKVDWSGLFKDKLQGDVRDLINDFYNTIRSGDEYVCVAQKIQKYAEGATRIFCSKKCVNDYEIFR